MFKALLDKKVCELRTSHAYLVFIILFVLSFLAVLAKLSWPSEISGLLLAPLVLIGFFLGFVCAVAAFSGDYVKEAQRFLEYLPVRRSAIWLVGYLTGVSLLCLSALLLFGTGLLLYQPPVPELEYFISGRIALAAAGGTALLWMFSIAVFSVAYLDTGKEGATSANVSGMLLGTMLLPVAVGVLLVEVHTLPSVTELIPIFLVSAASYSAGSFFLFALTPRHMKRASRAVCGGSLFLLLTAVLLGHLYLKHFTWRTLDPSEPLLIQRVWQPELESEPDLILANVMSYHSGDHCVSVDVAQSAYHDLGRWLTFLDVPGNDSGRLHFVYSRHGGYRGNFSALTMAPDGTDKHSFRVDAAKDYQVRGPVRWLQNPSRLLYPAYCEATQQSYLCVADSAGKLLKRFEVGSESLILSPTNQVLTLAPQEAPAGQSAPGTTTGETKPYMIIDVDADTVFRFGCPGQPLVLAKDLRRMICKRERIQGGFRYQSYVLVELPALVERIVLPEEAFPPAEITSQVGTAVRPTHISTSYQPTEFFCVADTFETAFWIKQRVEGDYFRYSIVSIDLNTGRQQVVIPESETPRLSVIATGVQSRTAPVTLQRSTADGSGFLFEIGQQIHRYDLATQEHAVVADTGVVLDDSERPDANYQTAFSPTGYRVVRYINIYEKSPDDPRRSQLKYGAIDVFQNSTPKRRFREKQHISGAFWLDEERIIFHTTQAIYSLNATAGSAQRIFPPATTVGKP